MNKKCLNCDCEFQRTHNHQKFCLECKKIIIYLQHMVYLRTESYRKKKAVYDKNYRKINKKHIRQLKHNWKQRNRIRLAKKRVLQYKKDIKFRLLSLIRLRIIHALQRNSKVTNTIKLIGCSIEELKNHLEKQFNKDMNWTNWGQFGWHIDHIRPCSSFDLSDPKQQKQCFHYSNLQPLWWYDNLSKKDKIYD